MYFEHGALLGLKEKVKAITTHRLQRNIELFENLKNFVDAASSKYSPNVKLYNIKNLFAYFCVAWLLIITLFVLHVLLSWQLQTANRNLFHNLFRNLFLLLGYRNRTIAPQPIELVEIIE